MPTPLHARLAALVVVALFASTGCSSSSTSGSSSPPDSPPASNTGDGTDPGSSPPGVDDPPGAGEPIAWESCGNGRECARVEAPLDYADPGGATIELAVARVPARSDRIGSLFVNFGGPGAEAARSVGVLGAPAAIRDRFDIVGMDPRGVGESTPLDCGIDVAELYGADMTIEDDADVTRLLDVSQRYVDDCQASRGALLPHVGTRNVARDMDLIRARMGDETINYLGYSYGTSIGQAYADLFPTRIRAMILDGLVDPAPPGLQVAADQAKGFETALANWAAKCSSRSSCTLADPVRSVEEVLADAETVVPSSSGRPLGPGEASTGLALPLYAEQLWPILDRAVTDALAGDGTRFVGLADQYLDLVDFSIYFAVSCLDNDWPDDPAAFLAAAKDAAAVSPHFGEAIVNDYIRCALWPVESDPIGAVTAPGAPPIVVVSGLGDPATPYENGVVVADRLESGLLFTYTGEGHTIVFQGDSCIDSMANAYLVDLTVPEPGGRC